MALDLVKRRAIRAAERLLPGADLKAVLADPFMMEVRVLLPLALTSAPSTPHSLHHRVNASSFRACRHGPCRRSSQVTEQNRAWAFSCAFCCAHASHGLQQYTASCFNSQTLVRLEAHTSHLTSYVSLSQAIGAAGKRAEGESAAEAASPAYRDELVCTLLATVDHHPWGARCQLLPAWPCDAVC